MSAYNPPRTRNLFLAGSSFSFSRTKIESFIKCPRCFYLDRIHGIDHPPGFPFNINSAVDTLLKREFDQYREAGLPHPMITDHGYTFIPYAHTDLNAWRENFKGARTTYRGYEFSGAIDDVWQNSEGELIIVDYKSTASSKPVKAIDKDHHHGYKRQMEFYQWLFRRMGFPVSDLGIFVYCTGDNSAPAFNGIVRFDIKLIPYTGSDAWVEPLLDELVLCAESNAIPAPGADCDMCKYYSERRQVV